MSRESLILPVLLTKQHELTEFDCGKIPLNELLRISLRKIF